MTNIFQFLKQGTSLSRKVLGENRSLEEDLLLKQRVRNDDFDVHGKFHLSDSEEEDAPKNNDPQQFQSFHKAKVQQSNTLRKRLLIKVKGTDVPSPMSNFTKMIKKYNIPREVVQGLQCMGYVKPTAVQMQVIPCLLQKTHTIVTAPTGTGKTLAFLLPLVSNLTQSRKILAIIMAPLQELATQISHQLDILAAKCQIKHQCCSRLTDEERRLIGVNKSPGFNILVTTPLSFLYLFAGHEKLLKHVSHIVLDECDKYFQQSFLEQISQFLSIFKQLHPVYGLFSATIQHPVEELLREQFLDDCVRVEVGGKNKVLSKIDQSIEYCTNEFGKLVFLRNMIFEGKLTPPVLIFVQEKRRAKQLYYEVKKILKSGLREGRKIELLTSDKCKEERQSILGQFEKGKYWILITTDIVARGIDFKNVNLVINYDFPNSMLTYIHRVGRTGRVQRKGTAVTLFTEEDKPVVRSLANLLTASGCTVPEWIQQMPKANKQTLKKLQRHPVRRLPVGISTPRDKHWEQEVQQMTKRWQNIQEKEKERQQTGDDEWTVVAKDTQL